MWIAFKLEHGYSPLNKIRAVKPPLQFVIFPSIFRVIFVCAIVEQQHQDEQDKIDND